MLLNYMPLHSSATVSGIIIFAKKYLTTIIFTYTSSNLQHYFLVGYNDDTIRLSNNACNKFCQTINRELCMP